MKKEGSAISPIVVIERKSATPIHRQIYDSFRNAILKGNLRPGQRVPSTRGLAMEVRISRMPVLTAYAQLLAEGYFESRIGMGTQISNSLPDPSPLGSRDTKAVKKLSGVRRVSSHCPTLRHGVRPQWSLGRGAFGVGQVAFDQFPHKIWSNLVARCA